MVARPPSPPGLSRRSLLLGGAGLALLAACGRDTASDDHDHAERLDLDRLDGEAGAALLAGFAFQGGYVAAGLPQRLTFLIADIDGPRTEVPDELEFELFLDGTRRGDPVTVAARRDGIPTPYFPLTSTFDEPGRWTAAVRLDDQEATQAFQVDERAEVDLVQVGEAVPPVETPTTADDRDVVPICTDDPACVLHDRSLSEALRAGQPTALLVSTPAYCQTGVCGPVLDLVVEAAPAHPEVQFVHAEVWRDAAARGVQAAAPAPVVEALGLTFEPSLFLIDAEGTLVERLDNVFDREELRVGLDQLS